jgi:type I site-specific restriction endonuclease
MTTARAATTLLLFLAACSGSPPAPGGSAPAAAVATPSPTPSPTPDPSRPLPQPIPDVVARVNGQDVRIQQILPIAKAVLEKVPLTERDKRKPEVVRQALDYYVNRELLLQEAIARGITAGTRDVERRYDALRSEQPTEQAWTAFLAGEAMDPQALKAELRVRQMVATLLDQELQSWPVPEPEARAAYAENPARFSPPDAAAPLAFEAVRAEVEAAVRQSKADEVHAALLNRLRARARIELFL